jgi:Ig-like domain CHU_C associated
MNKLTVCRPRAQGDADANGIGTLCGNCPPLPGTTPGYYFVSHQNNKPFRWMAMMAASLLLILLFTTGTTSLYAQKQLSLADESWWTLKTGDNSQLNASNIAFDAAGNGYVINKRGNDYYLSRRQTTGVVDTTWLLLGSTSPVISLDEFTVPDYFRRIVYKPSDGNLYIVWKRINSIGIGNPMDSVFVGQVTNLTGTPVFTKRWKAVDDVIRRYGDGPGGQAVTGLITLQISPSEDMYVIAKTRIHKISKNGVLTQSFCTPYQYYRTEIYEMSWDNNDNVYVTRRRYKDGPLSNVFYAPVDPYITKISPAGVADTTWFKATNDTLYEEPIRITCSNGFIYSSHVVVKSNSDTMYFWKVNAANGTGQLIKKMLYPLTLFSSRAKTTNAFSDNASNVYFGSMYPRSVLHRYSITGGFDSAWIDMNGPTLGVITTVSIGPANQMIMGPRVHYVNAGGFPPPPPPFDVTTYDYYYSKLVVSGFDVAIAQEDATCNGVKNGTAKAIPSGCSAGSYTYLWTPGNYTTDSIGGLAPGTYNVRIICSGDTVNKSVVIAAGSGPVAAAASNESLCNGSTVADLAASPESGNTIKWYAMAMGGTPLANSTPWVNGTKYYAAQVTPAGCESSTRAVDSVTILATVVLRGDSSYCNGSNIAVNFAGAAGNTYTWTATQNGTGISASGTGNTSFTGINNSTAVITDTISVSSAYTAPSSYTISGGVYAFADTTGSNYLNLGTTYSAGNLSGSIPIGFNFNFFGTNYSNIYISNLGSITFDAAATKLVYGQLRGTWTTDASSKIAYKMTGTAPNRKLIVSFINFNKPNDVNTTIPFGPPITTSYTADPATGRGAFQIVLNETSNTIESLKQSVPALTAFTIPIGAGPSGTVPGNYEGLKNGSTEYYVAGRNNGDWIKLSNESKVSTPLAGMSCAGQKDTFLVSILPVPAVDSIGNTQVCPGGTVSSINFTTPVTGGTVEYKWTNSNTSIGLAASGTGNLPSFTATGTGNSTVTVLPYMLKSATDTCFGTARTFTITADLPPAPGTTGNLLAYTGSKTLSQLNVTPLTGGTVNYYYAASGGTALAGSTPVVDDTTYYITQSISGCESTPRKAIKVNRIANDSAVNCGPVTVGSLVATPLPGNTAQWFDVPTGGTALNTATALPAGQDTLYVQEGSVKTDTLVSRVGSYVDYIISLTHDENDTLYYGTFGSNNVYRANPDGSAAGVLFNGGGTIRSVVYRKEGADRFLYYLNDGSAIRKKNLATGVTTNIGSGLFNPSQIAFDDANGVIYVADGGNSKLKKIVVATNTITTVDSFITIPAVDYNRIFGVAFNPATNTIFFNNFDKGKVYAKNLSGNNPRVQILSVGAPKSISLTANGKLLIASGNGVVTCNQDGSSVVTLKSGLYDTNEPFYNNNGELTYTHLNSVNKEANNLSNRAPVTVIVNPTPDVTATNDIAVCNNATVAAVNFSTTTTGGTVSYSWTNNNTNIGLAASGTGNIPSFVGKNNGNSPDTASIVVTPMVNNAGLTCEGAKDTFYIVVNPVATVNPVSNQVFCNTDKATAVNFGSPATGGSIVYNWTNSNPAIGLAASGTGNIASFTSTNNGSAPITSTITVTATYSNAGANCSSAAQTFTYTVHPAVTMNTISNQTVCNSTSITAVNFSSAITGGTVSYSWTNSDPSIGLAASGNGNIPSFNAVNAGSSPVTATITVTPSFTNAGVTCTGSTRSFTITVNPVAVLSAVNDQTVCAGASNNSVSFGSPVAGTTYSWTNSNPAIGLAASGTGNVPSFVAVNASPNAITATITVTPSAASGCAGLPITYTITVNGKSVAPTSINNPTPIVCASDAFANLTVNNGALGSGAAWKWYADSVNTVSIGTGSSLKIAVAKTTTYLVRAEGTCNNTTAAAVVVQRANLVHHVRQHWSDVLLFDNSGKNYLAWQWYRNGSPVAGATLQQYSENTALVGSYYVVATDINGVQSISCPLTITAGSFTGLRISLFPNPADNSRNVTVSASFTASELQGANLIISDVFGRVVKQLNQVSPVSTVQAPAATGMYIVTLTLQNGMKYSANLLTK